MMTLQDAWSLAGRSLAVLSETYLARQLIVAVAVMMLLKLLRMTLAINPTAR